MLPNRPVSAASTWESVSYIYVKCKLDAVFCLFDLHTLDIVRIRTECEDIYPTNWIQDEGQSCQMCTMCSLKCFIFKNLQRSALWCVESFLFRPGVNIRPKWSDHKWTAPGKVWMHSRCIDTHLESEGVWAELIRRVILAVCTGTSPWPHWRSAYSMDEATTTGIVIQIPSLHYQFNGEFRRQRGLSFNNSGNDSFFWRGVWG